MANAPGRICWLGQVNHVHADSESKETARGLILDDDGCEEIGVGQPMSETGACRIQPRIVAKSPCSKDLRTNANEFIDVAEIREPQYGLHEIMMPVLGKWSTADTADRAGRW